MPRKKTHRHFDARYGVSQAMVDVEATYVAREHEDYLLLATNDMQQKLHELRGKWSEADQTAEMLVRQLPEREALAFQCLLVRDLFLVLELYATTMRTSLGANAPTSVPSSSPVAAAAPVPKQSADERTKQKTLPFNEWLFDPLV